MQLKGIYAPIVTPFNNNDYFINYEVLKKLIDFVLANGLVGTRPRRQNLNNLIKIFLPYILKKTARGSERIRRMHAGFLASSAQIG